MRSLIAPVLLTCLCAPSFALGNPNKTPGIVQCAEPTTPGQAPATSRRSTRRLGVSANASPGESRRLLDAAIREGSRVSLRAEPRPQEAATRTSPSKSWISRHPALFGTLVGAGAGAIASGTMENELFCSGGDEDCFFHGGSRLLVGAAMGAGIGALIGFIGSL